MMSTFGLAEQYLSKGMGLDALKKAIDTIPGYNQIRNFKIGYGVKWAYLKDAQGPLKEIADMVEFANGRVGQDACHLWQWRLTVEDH